MFQLFILPFLSNSLRQMETFFIIQLTLSLLALVSTTALKPVASTHTGEQWRGECFLFPNISYYMPFAFWNCRSRWLTLKMLKFGRLDVYCSWGHYKPNISFVIQMIAMQKPLKAVPLSTRSQTGHLKKQLTWLVRCQEWLWTVPTIQSSSTEEIGRGIWGLLGGEHIQLAF